MKNTTKLRTKQVRAITSPVIKGLLETVAVAGAVGVTVVAPNTTGVYAKLLNKLDASGTEKSKFAYRASRGGHFSVEEQSAGRYTIKLTDKGRKAYSDLLFEDYQLPRKLKWDGTWHILMFDISERHKAFRDVLTAKIKAIGMKPLQNSVYVYPFPIDDFVQSLRSAHPVGTQFVLNVKATEISGEEQLIEIFRKNGTLLI